VPCCTECEETGLTSCGGVGKRSVGKEERG